MIRIIQRNIVRFFILVLIQALLFNNVMLFNFINPYVYVLFILLLPFETPKLFILFSSFLLGFSVDIFNNSIGIHAAASVFMAYLRPFVLSSIASRDGYETNTFPRIHYYGLWWFVRYSFVLVLFHHSILYIVEIFSFRMVHITLLNAFLNVLFTLAIIIPSQYIVYRK